MSRVKHKNSLEKKNWRKTFSAIHQPILRMIHDAHNAGGYMSNLDDVAMNNLASAMTKNVMKNEKIDICLKRTKQC